MKLNTYLFENLYENMVYSVAVDNTIEYEGTAQYLLDHMTLGELLDLTIIELKEYKNWSVIFTTKQ